ncbi:MAG TPA: hypothetical protein VHE33_16585 [Acidobacteriaceae bacterium]|nr:hypothetical protein [Acidobacteriaceae bacterium]
MASPARQAKPPRHEVLSLEVLARPESQSPEGSPGQFRVLVQHFLDRFFNNELASGEGDAKTRLVQAACTIGIPGLVVAMYLYPVYHLPRGHVGRYWGPRPFWSQVGDHYFYVVYSMVAMGLVTIFEWDLLFPDLLDVVVLSPLPTRSWKMLGARVAAIFILLGAALFDANFLAPLVLPAAVDPPHLVRFWAAHLLAVAASGGFGAAFFLALEGALLGLLGDRLFRKISLWLQGLFVWGLLTLLFLYPAMAGTMSGLLAPDSPVAAWVPSFWFLGIYQRILDGPSTPAIFVRLAHIAEVALIAAIAVAIASYPLAWWRKTRSLVEGTAKRETRNWAVAPVQWLVHLAVARTPASRAIWQFIGQNLLRIPRYRMVLVMYGGMGLALLFATVTRVALQRGHLLFFFSRDGLRATVPIVAFWTVSGLHSTFLAPADQRGRWIFRAILGKAGIAELVAAKRWVLFWSALLSMTAAGCAYALAAGPRSWLFAADQLLVSLGWSLILTDLFFLNATSIPFTGARPNSATNFALLLIPYLGFFPAVVMFTVALEPVLEVSVGHLACGVGLVAVAHLILHGMHRSRIADHVHGIEPDEDEEEFPLRLGLRY